MNCPFERMRGTPTLRWPRPRRRQLLRPRPQHRRPGTLRRTRLPRQFHSLRRPPRPQVASASSSSSAMAAASAKARSVRMSAITSCNHLSQLAQRHAGVVRQMQMHAATPALDQRHQVACGLGFRQLLARLDADAPSGSGISFNSSADRMRKTPMFGPPFCS